jgi:hypothetical protein
MPSQPPEYLLRRIALRRGWLIPAALFALVPKCVLCVLAYAGLGAALGLGGPELCGGSDDSAGWPAWLVASGAVLGIAGFLSRRTTRPKPGK